MYINFPAAIPVGAHSHPKYSMRRSGAGETGRWRWVRQIGQLPPYEKGSSILRQFARDQALAEAAVREDRRSVRVLQQHIVTGAKVGMGQEVEGSLCAPDLRLRGGIRIHAPQAANSVREPQIGGVAVGRVRKSS